jgi:hypothetical protein
VGEDAVILRTTDGGVSWARQAAPAGVTATLRAVYFGSADQGVAAGDGAVILRTTDGGVTWSRQAVPAGVVSTLRAVHVATASQVVVVGDDTTILRTTDGGAAWTSQLAPAELGVSAGRFWVKGILCENERPTALAGQPDPPGLDLPTSGTHLFYLDVWQRHLTSVERPELREVALAGPDTTTRTKTVWQVKWEEAAGKACMDFADRWVPDGASSTGQLAARAVPSPSVTDPCLVPPGAGYRRLENQCYRVEIHAPGPAGTATFTWSRDNGSVVSRVEQVNAADAVVTIADPGKDAEVGFASAEFVELTDERRILAGRPGTLVEVDTLQGNDLVIHPGTALPALGSGAVARRWESAEVSVTAGQWEDLEGGVQVRFTDGEYQSGDFWLIPARTLTGTVEWPVEDGEPVFEPRQGIDHSYCPLGILTVQTGIWTLQHDCRLRSPYLTDLTTLYDVGGQGQESLPGEPLPQLLEVASPVSGVSVRFSTEDGGLVAPTKADLPSATDHHVTVQVGDDRIASCAWELKPDGQPSQQLEATLLDDAGEAIGRPVRFAANLSLASQVSYTGPAGCATLTGATSVQSAIDALAQANSLFFVAGDGQESLPGQPLPQPLQVGVRSACGPAAVTVRFSTTANGRVARTAGELPTATNRVDVSTVNGIASCAWRLDPNVGNPSQQATATLLDPAGNPVGMPVHFTANLSLASQVFYDPRNCPNLDGVQTVQQAIDRLCRGSEQEPGIHIKEVVLPTGAPLLNDTLVPFALLKEGIHVVCDQAIDRQSVSGKPVFIVTVDMPYPLTTADREFWRNLGSTGLVGFEPLILAADVGLAGENVISWVPRRPTVEWLQSLLNAMGQFGLGDRVLTHVTLKGNFIWSRDDTVIFLDGEAFGFPAGDGTTGVRLPSGDGRRGGDFEMWFWLVQG